SHRVLKPDTTRAPAPNHTAQQQRFRRFCTEYNDERPHEALADRSPVSCYTRSPRPLPARVPAIEYPGHVEVRRVSSIGQVSWKAQKLYLTEVLSGEDVAFDEVDDGVWILYFASMRLARFDERTGTL